LNDHFVSDAFCEAFFSPRQIPVRPNRRLSLLPIANKQICLSLGIQRHFRLGEDRAVAQKETTAARCGLSSAWEGRTKGIYDVHLSSLYPLSFLFPLPLSLSLSLLYRTIPSVLPSALSFSPRLSTPFLFIRLYHHFLANLRFALHLFVWIPSRVERRKTCKCIFG